MITQLNPTNNTPCPHDICGADNSEFVRKKTTEQEVTNKLAVHNIKREDIWEKMETSKNILGLS